MDDRTALFKLFELKEGSLLVEMKAARIVAVIFQVPFVY
jgi:hypothetical protein